VNDPIFSLVLPFNDYTGLPYPKTALSTVQTLRENKKEMEDSFFTV